MFCCVVHTLVLLPAQGHFVQWDGRTNVLIAPPSAFSLLCHVQVFLMSCIAYLYNATVPFSAGQSSCQLGSCVVPMLVAIIQVH